MNKEDIKELANKIGAEILVRTAGFTKDTWRVEFEAITNIKIPMPAIDGMVLEGICFAIYYINKRAKGILDEKEEKQFIDDLKEYMIWSLSTLYFESPHKESDPKKHEEGVRELFNQYFDKRMKAYSEYNKGNVALLYKDLLMYVFNGNESINIKFVQGTFKNRFMIGLAKTLDAMGGGKSGVSKYTELKTEVLDNYSKLIVESLFEIDIQKSVNDLE